MSTVRVLVGTKKGAFILTADGARRDWQVSGPHFAGWGDVSPQGFARGAEPHLRLADERLVWAGHPAFGRRRQNVGVAAKRYSEMRPTYRQLPYTGYHKC